MTRESFNRFNLSALVHHFTNSVTYKIMAKCISDVNKIKNKGNYSARMIFLPLRRKGTKKHKEFISRT